MQEFTALRSLMFVSANVRRRWEKAHTRGADAVILDLEDGVGPTEKDEAREMLGEAVDFLAAQGSLLLVRVNAPWLMAVEDVKAAARPGVRALLVPKVESAARLGVLGEMLDELEAERGLPAGGVGLVAMIESPQGVEALTEIAAAPRVRGVALGTEDFSLSMGVEPNGECLDLPSRMIAFATRARGLAGLAVPASIVAIGQPEAYGAAARRARAMGLTGGLCADPKQVIEVNAAFSPSQQEVAAAEALLAAWAAGGGQGVVRFEGGIIDIPVVRRAERVLAQAQAAQR